VSPPAVQEKGVTDVLSPYRVLDLTDERGHFAGMILAALGAEVVKIEPPDGVRTRRLGPFDDAGRSLRHAAYDRGKQSVTIDLTTDDGRQQLRDLAAGADVLLDSLGPGALASLGIDFSELLELNPALVIGTVTAFGHDGPKAHWPVTDLTLMASACTLAFTGDSDRAPVRVTVPQAFHFGAAVLAGGVVAALIERGASGHGQIVDVAAQQVIPIATQGGVLSEACNFPTPTRSAGGAKVGPIELRFVYPAADGFVSITHVFGDSIGPVTARLMDWAAEEGHVDPAIAAIDWVNFATLVETGEVSIEEWELAKAGVASLTASKTKAELLEAAMERRLLLAPIADPADVLASEQLAFRRYFEPLKLASTEIQAPGPFAKLTATPLRTLDAVPAPGEHTAAVVALPRSVERPVAEPPRGNRPLEGVKVLDFMWSLAGPFSTRALADLGATVVKVESVNKPDAARGFLPIWDNVPGLEQSALFDSANAGKLSLALDMRKPEAIEVVKRLVGWADLVTESFSPRAMKGWGLDYERLREINPGLIMFSTCLTGQNGPLANFAGYGNLGAALSGFYGLAGWKDRPPAGPFGAYTDYTSTHLMLVTLLSAIDHRRRTGEGQHIDIAQAEAAAHYIAPALLDVAATGHVTERGGNRDPEMAPHGVYPCSGDDRWVAIAVPDDTAWERLCAAAGFHELAADGSLGTTEGRLAQAERLDELLARWTSGRSVTEVEELLVTAGVPVHGVQSSTECLADPQLAHRGHFLWVEHPERGCIIEASRFKMSRSENSPRGRAPFLGEHSFDVLTDILGLDADDIADLAAAEVLE
jgi:crotonobetainyl-CoA:carnitine CoA-transferase CaiB-like acyl-CoA transferase